METLLGMCDAPQRHIGACAAMQRTHMESAYSFRGQYRELDHGRSTAVFIAPCLAGLLCM
jgi:hypothetical protein